MATKEDWYKSFELGLHCTVVLHLVRRETGIREWDVGNNLRMVFREILDGFTQKNIEKFDDALATVISIFMHTQVPHNLVGRAWRRILCELFHTVCTHAKRLPMTVEFLLNTQEKIFDWLRPLVDPTDLHDPELAYNVLLRALDIKLFSTAKKEDTTTTETTTKTTKTMNSEFLKEEKNNMRQRILRFLGQDPMDEEYEIAEDQTLAHSLTYYSAMLSATIEELAMSCSASETEDLLCDIGEDILLLAYALECTGEELCDRSPYYSDAGMDHLVEIFAQMREDASDITDQIFGKVYCGDKEAMNYFKDEEQDIEDVILDNLSRMLKNLHNYIENHTEFTIADVLGHMDPEEEDADKSVS